MRSRYRERLRLRHGRRERSPFSERRRLAIEFLRVGTQTEADGTPIEDTGFLAPVVDPVKCVGCGLCQTRCHGINVEQKGLLGETAIRITVENQDRLAHGSYVALRDEERTARDAARKKQKEDGGDDYLPDFLK